MKKLSFALMAAVLGFTSCQDSLEQPIADEDGNVTFTVTAPEAFGSARATLGPNSNSSLGGITNVDWDAYDLRYQLAVYEVGDDGNGNKTYTEVVSPMKKVVDTYRGVSYVLQLAPNRKYNVVVWADFVTQGSTDDLHYDTSDFTDIKCTSTSTTHLNDESRDAYFVQQEFELGATTANRNLVLKRPFGKLRLVTTDWKKGDLEMADTYRITYYGCKRFRGINAITGDACDEETLPAKEASTEVYTTTINKAELDYALNIDRDQYCRTVVVDYLMCDYDIIGAETIHFQVDAIDSEQSDKLIASHDFNTDIPLRRNWLTTIMGDLHTIGAHFNIECEELFDGKYNDYYQDYGEIDPQEPTYEEATNTWLVANAPQLAWFADNMSKVTFKNGMDPTIKLTADIELNGAEWRPLNYWAPDHFLTFDGDNHVIRNMRIMAKGTERGLFGHATANFKDLTISNVVIAQASLHSGSLCGNLYGDCENVTILDAYVVADGSLGYGDGNFQYDAILPNIWNLGGMIGIHNGGNLTNCHVRDVYVESGWRAGGMVGFVNENSNRVYTNCTVEEAKVWIRFRWLTPSSYNRPVDGTIDEYPDQLLSVGAITSYVYSKIKLTMNNCSSSNVVYKIGNVSNDYLLMLDDQSLFVLNSGEEGEHKFIDRHGILTYYGPINSLVGLYDDDTELVIDGTSYYGLRNNPQWLNDFWKYEYEYDSYDEIYNPD